MKNEESTSPQTKRKISDYFAKPEESEDKKKKTKSPEEQSTQTDVNVQMLKCPKRKVLIGEESDGIAESSHKKRTGVKMKELPKGQMVLDCGQSSIGTTLCEECGMVYCVDDAEDVKTHEKFHDEFINKYEIPAAHVDTFLRFYDREHGNYKVYYLGNFAPNNFKDMMRTHFAEINKELGYTSEEEVWHEEKRIFFVMMTKNEKMYIGGICVAEKIHVAWTDTTRKEISDNNIIDDWIVGIDRVWVNPSCRKKGIAYALLDAATTQDRQMEYRIRRLRIAFSDPTDDGKALAKRYTETRYQQEDRFDGEFLVY